MVERVEFGRIGGEVEGRHTCRRCGEPIGKDSFVIHSYLSKGGFNNIYKGSYCSWKCREAEQ